jgi:hypothetical protein
MNQRKCGATDVTFLLSCALLAGCRGSVLAFDPDGQAPVNGDPVAMDDGAVPAQCAYAGPYSDGSGYFSSQPLFTTDPDGPRLPLVSPSQVAAAMVGTYSGTLDLPNQPPSVMGVEFTGDGRFVLLVSDPDYNLVRSTASSAAGTFDVVDASGTLGAGTYQARFHTSDGGVRLAQIVIFDSPRKVRLFSPSPGELMPAQKWQFRANVCGPAFGPSHAFTSATDVAARIRGRWIWCSGLPWGAFGAALPTDGAAIMPLRNASIIGIEFPGDGTWYLLAEDESGNVVRAAGLRDVIQFAHGTLQPDPSGALNMMGGDRGRVTVDECRRSLRYSYDEGHPEFTVELTRLQ